MALNVTIPATRQRACDHRDSFRLDSSEWVKLVDFWISVSSCFPLALPRLQHESHRGKTFAGNEKEEQRQEGVEAFRQFAPKT